MEFGRRSNESIDDLLVRFEITRMRAQAGGRLVISSEGMAWKLLMACRVTPDQLLTLMQPFGNRLPHNEAEMRALFTALRRIGHYAPDNVAQHLRRNQGGPNHHAPTYMVTEGTSSSSNHGNYANNQVDAFWRQGSINGNNGWNLRTWGETQQNS